MKKYCIEYRHNGRIGMVEYHADNWEDAERRLRSLKGNGEVTGEIVFEAPVNTVTAFPIQIYLWFKRLFR